MGKSYGWLRDPPTRKSFSVKTTLWWPTWWLTWRPTWGCTGARHGGGQDGRHHDMVTDMFAGIVTKLVTLFLLAKLGTPSLVRMLGRGLVNWVQTFSTQSLPSLRIFY